MLKHTQIIRRQIATNCLSVLDHFVGLSLKGLIFTQKNMLTLKPYMLGDASEKFDVSEHKFYSGGISKSGIQDVMSSTIKCSLVI